MQKKQKKEPEIFLKKNLGNVFWKLLSNFWPLLIFIAAAVIFFHPVIFQNKVPFPGDFVAGVYYPWLDYNWGFPTGVPVKNPITTDVPSFIFPMQMQAVDMLKEGVWPLWNPYILGGTPLLANFQSAPFSPTNFIYFLTDKISAWSFQIMLQHILAALFTYFLLREWKVSKVGSVLGGVLFAYSGFNLIWSQWNGHALSAAFIPLILLFQARYFRKPCVWNGIGFSLSLAGQILSGYPQVVLYTATAIGVLWIFRIWILGNWLKTSLTLGLFGGLGILLASFQLFPGLELLSLSQREVEPHPFEWAFLPWSKVITLFAPDYFGNHATYNYWGPQDYTSNTGFVGVVAVILATVGLEGIRRIREIRVLTVLGIVALLLSLPTPLSVFLWKSGFLGFQAASAHRALVLFNLSIALLAGFGMDKFLKEKIINLKLKLAIPYLVVGGFSLVTLYLYFSSRANPEELGAIVRGIDKFQVGLRNLVIPIGILGAVTGLLLLATKVNKLRFLAGVILLGLMCFELFRFGWKFTPFSPRDLVFPKTPVLEFLQSQNKPFRTTGNQVIPINLRMPYEIEALEGYDAVYPGKTAYLIGAINENNGDAKPAGRYGIIDNRKSQVLDIANVKYHLAKSSEINVSQDLEKVFQDKSVAILESKKTLPRAKMFYSVELETGRTNILAKLTDPQFNFDKTLIVENDFSMNFEASGQGEVEYEKYSEQESIIKVKTSSHGLLYVSDTWYPGWKAFVDNAETEIYRANFNFRAVLLPKGEHEVRFVYQPEAFFNGLKFSIFSLFGLFLVWPAVKFLEKVLAKNILT